MNQERDARLMNAVERIMAMTGSTVAQIAVWEFVRARFAAIDAYSHTCHASSSVLSNACGERA
jgi:hypothetical protein